MRIVVVDKEIKGTLEHKTSEFRASFTCKKGEGNLKKLTSE